MTKEPVFYCKTVQTNAIKILFEALKNILSDVNFNADKSGLKLTTIDGTEKAIVNLFLNSEKFEEYVCKGEFNIGLNLISNYKILKAIKNTDTISFAIYRNELEYFYISTTHSDKKFTNTSKIKLLDMNEKIYNIPDINFESFITMPSSDFQGYISDLSSISNKINIKTSSKELILSVKGDFAEQTMTINEANSKNQNSSNVQEGIFDIKFIQLFTKSTNLCSTVEIYLKSQYPLTMVYNVANLGHIKYCLAPE